MASRDPGTGTGTDKGTGTGTGTDTDRPGRIEAHGIDHVPDRERHGRARELFPVWAAANVNYLSMVVGGALILMGLSLGQAVAVIVLGSLFWAPIGLLAASGPASGTPSEVIARAMYGVRGNRVNIAVNGWLLCICYIALNLAAAAFAAFVLVEKAGIDTNSGVKVAVVVVIAALTLAIGVYGHATMVKLYPPIALALTVTFAVVAGYVCTRADLGHQPARPLTGVALWATLAAGLTLIASGPLSYTNSADFSRYLPRDASPWAVAGWTALGGFLPGVLLTSLGALAATVLDMTEPQAGLEGILPAWFSPVFLLAIVLGTIANNAMTAYSSGLALQAAGVHVRRSLGVLVDGALGVAVTLYALLVSNFLDTVGNLLQLTVVVLGPSTAVYATDILLRGCRYDGPALTDESPGSPFWYTGGVNLAGALALTAGIAASALCVDTLYTGPVARALGGVDLSLPVGIVVSASLYGLLMHRSLRGRSIAPPA
ncbi:purine-cytosine permease family protein [Streptomyces sp. NBC_01264]|uniref:purine-cytosine permease family protein n=1 Tax=Streptomyces sp. NBC_01264 TaxID=2903804 RepID=UPI0022589E5A|nr:cytosine permease [Streptomyces sp. NBC_01264]MCX4775703.1 cytosine permease [Streptomyces sp. NBC_01264]